MAALNQLGDVPGNAYWEGPFVYFSDIDASLALRDFMTAEDRDRWTSVAVIDINTTRQMYGGGRRWIATQRHYSQYALRIISEFAANGALLTVRIEEIGSADSVALSINEWGDVVGRYTDEYNDRAFVYSDSSGFMDIGDLRGGRAVAQTINNFGEVASSSNTPNGETRAFLYIPGQGMQDLGLIKVSRHSNRSVGYGINDALKVVGHSTQLQNTVDAHAFRWTEAGGMKDLGTLGSFSSAVAVNPQGQVVGLSRNKEDNLRGFLYTDETDMPQLEPEIIDLPQGVHHAQPIDINGAGEISATLRCDNYHSYGIAVRLTPIE